MHTTTDPGPQPTRWTRPLQLLVMVSAMVFTAGTALQNFAVADLALMETTMRLAGQTAAEAAANAPGFLLGFRVVGCLYIVGNAIGILALRGWSWVFWTVLVVNVTQAAGVAVIPAEFWQAAQDRYGAAGLLPSIVTDGGAVLVSVVLLLSLVVHRGAWARRRAPQRAGR